MFSTERLPWPVGLPEILAGCCTVLCFLLFGSIAAHTESGVVVEKSERHHCHCEFVCVAVPGSTCKALLLLLFSYLSVTTAPPLSMVAAQTNKDLFSDLLFGFPHCWRHPKMNYPSLWDIGQWVRTPDGVKIWRKQRINVPCCNTGSQAGSKCASVRSFWVWRRSSIPQNLRICSLYNTLLQSP